MPNTAKPFPKRSSRPSWNASPLSSRSETSVAHASGSSGGPDAAPPRDPYPISCVPLAPAPNPPTSPESHELLPRSQQDQVRRPEFYQPARLPPLRRRRQGRRQVDARPL